MIANPTLRSTADVYVLELSRSLLLSNFELHLMWINAGTAETVLLSKNAANYAEGYTTMKFRLMSLACAISLSPIAANAQLTIDMNNITCGQYLAMQPSQSRSFSAWMSGWFSYQLNKETIDLLTHEKNIANVKAWCQYHPQDTVMSGLKNATGQ